MNTHAERQAAAAADRQRIAAAYEEAQEEARRVIQAAAATRNADAAELEALVAREDDEAKANVFAAGDARLLPVIRAVHDESTNRGVVALVEVIEALDQLALAGTGEAFPLLRVALLLAELHRQARPGILEHLAAERAWHSRGGGGLGGAEFADHLRRAVQQHDVAGARAAFEQLDAKLWSLTQRPLDEQALVKWQVQLQPDPRVQRLHQAALAEREREAQAAAAEAGCLAAIKHGGARLGWPETGGVTYA